MKQNSILPTSDKRALAQSMFRQYDKDRSGYLDVD
jgi:Ca2+-binding EF-hand superfamily protein